MALTRYEPGNAVRSAFSPLLSGNWADRLGSADIEWPLGGLRERAFPPVEIREDDGHFYVAAELPGYAPDQVEVTAEGNTLTISGRREAQESDASVSYSERVSGSFVRRLTLPNMEAGEVAEARMENGLLKIKLQKAEHGRRKRINVSTQ